MRTYRNRPAWSMLAAAAMVLPVFAGSLAAESPAPWLEKQDLFQARTNGYWTCRIPGIAVTKRDVVLVTTEARPGRGGDYDFNDVLMRRSTDGGKTFGPIVKLVDHTTYGKGPVSNFVMIPDPDSGRIVAVFHHDYARAFTLHSEDDGATWSKPAEITEVFEAFKPNYPWVVCANGCGHGLQLRNGRMIVPVWLSNGGKGEFGPKHRGHRPSDVALIYSDDRGVTWRRGGFVARNDQIVAGVFRSLVEGAAERGIALIPKPTSSKYQPHGWHGGQLTAGIPFDPYRMAAYLDERMLEAGVAVRLLTHFVDATVEAGRITHVLLFNKSGMTAVQARAVVDATGDADVAERSGCEVVQGREEDGLMTPASLILHVSHVDQDALAAAIERDNSPRFKEQIAALRDASEWTFPYEIFISVQLEEKGTLMINTIRLVGINGTDGASVSEGMIRGRAEVQKLLVLMRKHFPGFAQARLKTVAPLLGVRETRRIRGVATLSLESMAQGKEFDDVIGFSAYGWDLPDPKHPSDNPGHGRKPPVVPIPYRTLVPRSVTNLICPGRALSVERPVLGPLRVMAPCMAMGEAAGQAALQAVGEGRSFAEVDPVRLRRELAENNAVVEWK